MPELTDWIASIPKTELHVHIEGSIRPETLLKLAKRHDVALPAKTVEELQAWYTFTDFVHFVEIYTTISSCIRTPDDIELITREFLEGQAAQNITYTEATYTAYTLFKQSGIAWKDQLSAVNRARNWAKVELGVELGLVIDVVRELTAEEAMLVADWAIDGFGNGVCAFGLSGVESVGPATMFADAFAKVKAAGLPITTHAGETAGPWSIGACLAVGADRIGHGVRCLEDPELVARLRDAQTILEVCPSSNVCLGVFPTLEAHPLPQMLEAGLAVTINSDDPPLFSTTFSNEWALAHDVMGVSKETLMAMEDRARAAAFR